MRSTFVQGIDYLSTILFFDKTARLIAGLKKFRTNEPLRSYVRKTALNNFYISPFKSVTRVEMAGFEPATFALQRRCSPTELHPQDILLG